MGCAEVGVEWAVESNVGGSGAARGVNAKWARTIAIAYGALGTHTAATIMRPLGVGAGTLGWMSACVPGGCGWNAKDH